MAASAESKKKKKKGKGLKSAVFYRRMAQLSMMREDLNSAAENYKMVLKVDPNDSKASKSLGDLYSAVGDFDHSSEYYEKARTLGDDSVETAYGLVNVYHIRGKYKEAMTLLDGYEGKGNENITDIDLLAARAMCLVKLDKFDEAEKAVEAMKTKGAEPDRIEEFRTEIEDARKESEITRESLEKAEKAVGGKAKAPAAKKAEKPEVVKEAAAEKSPPAPKAAKAKTTKAAKAE